MDIIMHGCICAQALCVCAFLVAFVCRCVGVCLCVCGVCVCVCVCVCVASVLVDGSPSTGTLATQKGGSSWRPWAAARAPAGAQAQQSVAQTRRGGAAAWSLASPLCSS
jgi:hypothetical protein